MNACAHYDAISSMQSALHKQRIANKPGNADGCNIRACKQPSAQIVVLTKGASICGCCKKGDRCNACQQRCTFKCQTRDQSLAMFA
jgi:hypothetical protein